MKKLYSIIFILSALICLNACVNEEDDIFDESASGRMDTALAGHKDILTSASNGWVMEYYPSTIRQYGGYTFLLSFDDTKTTVASETYPSVTETSLYSLKSDNGPVLSFDTYNSLMHFFSDPENPSGIGTNGRGMEGDYEFIILESTPELIRLKGKKTQNYIYMYPLESSVEWSGYLNSLLEAEEKMDYPTLECRVGSLSASVLNNSFRTLRFQYESDGDEVDISVPFIQTLTGYKLYEPFEIGGVEITEFTFVENSGEIYFDGGNGVTLSPIILPLNEQLVNGNWYFAFSGLGSYGQWYWNYTNVNGLRPLGEELYYAYIGNYSSTYYGFGFGSYNGAGVYVGALGFNYELTGEDTITYTFAATGQDDGVWYYQNASFAYIIQPLIGKFTLTTDNPASPSWILLTSTSNAENTIRLYPYTVYWPFEK